MSEIRSLHENLDAYVVSLGFLDLATGFAWCLPHARGHREVTVTVQEGALPRAEFEAHGVSEGT